MTKGGFNGMPKKLTEEIVKAAIDGFTAQKAHLSQRIAELRAMLNGGSPQAAASEPAPRRHRKMSAAARRRIAMAQRARWAKVRGESGPGPAKVKARKPKRQISPQGLKRIIAATKKRWRLQRVAAKASKRKGHVRKAA
jgi:cell division septum initiation protein DivIVA